MDISVSEEENDVISHDPENISNTSTTVATVVAPEPEPSLENSTHAENETPARPGNKRPPFFFREAFRFDLKNFLPGRGDLSLRHFSITEATVLLVMAYLTSKGLGLVRQTIFDYLFGAGDTANAYYAASRLPDTLFDLIAGGALTHALIPVLLSYEKDNGKVEAWRLASLVFNLLLVAFTVLVFVSEFLAPTFVSNILVPGYAPATKALTTTLTRILLIQPLVLGVGTVATALLNSKRQFLLPAVSIAMYNVGVIGGTLFSLFIPGLGIYGPTYGILAAAVLQVGVQVPPLIKQGVRYTFTWNLNHPGLRDVLRLLGPNSLAIAVASIGLILDTTFISFMKDHTSLAAARNAHMLFALPLALVALSIGQATLPQLSVQVASGRYVRMRNTTLKIVAATLVLSILAATFLYLFGKPLIHLLYQHGAFNKHATAVTGTALLGYAVALPGLAIAQLLALSFYALKDALTPLVTNILALGIRIGLLFTLLNVFTGSHAIIAIPLASAGAGIVESLLLGCLLYFRLRSKVKLDLGMQRLTRWRTQIRNIPIDPGNVEAQMIAPVTELDVKVSEDVEETVEPVANSLEEAVGETVKPKLIQGTSDASQ